MMIEMKGNELIFSFPEVHPRAGLSVDFQRTLRIPDDGDDYPLPPGLGSFPLVHVDDHAGKAPAEWLRHGGVMLPMYQSEAMWLNFDSVWIEANDADFPFAVKVAAGKINAVTGDVWNDGLHRRPQDYMTVPEQPWLDGYCVEKGLIRQFVAMPLGAGYTAEEQLTGKAEFGGLQIVVYPMKRDVFERRFRRRRRPPSEEGMVCDMPCPDPFEMGLAAGGRMRQEIYDDPFRLSDWDHDHSSRCFVHISNSLVWRSITGETPPTVPPTATEYTEAGLPWFEYYSDAAALAGAANLAGLKSVAQLGKEKGDVPLPENDSVSPENVIALRRLKKDQVREGTF